MPAEIRRAQRQRYGAPMSGATQVARPIGGWCSGAAVRGRGSAAAERPAVQGGAANLGVLLERRGDEAGAEAAYRRADERGHAGGAFMLGVLLERRGDDAGAEAAMRRADARGHPGGASNVGVLLERCGDEAGA